MIEFDVVVWLMSVVGADCGICNLLNNVANDFNNIIFGTGVLGVGAATVGAAAAQVVRDPIGTASNTVSGLAGAAGTVAGTAVGVAGTVAGAAVDVANDAHDAFNQGYQNASGRSGSTPATSGTESASGPPQVEGPFGPVPGPPSGSQTTPPGGFGRGPTQSLPGQMPQGTLNYFNTGAPTGSQLGGQG